MSENLQLSASSLAALKDFALSKGIVKDDDDDYNNEENVDSLLHKVRDHFTVKDREEIFKFKFGRIEFNLNGLKRELGQTLSSTGLTLWRAAEHLSNYCFSHPDIFTGKTVLELGAGIGVVSILIDKLEEASLVVASDGDDDTVQLLERNIKDVHSKVIPAKVYWGHHQDFKLNHRDGFDMILAADVIYEDDQVSPLLDAVVDLIRSGGSFYLAYARRNIPIDRVLIAASLRGLEWVIVEPGELELEPIYRMYKK